MIERPKYIYVANEDEGVSSACAYYRIATPMLSLGELCDMKIYQTRKTDPADIKVRSAFASDVCFYYSIVGSSILHQIDALRRARAGVQGDGSLKVPPVVVWDCDDNTDFVHPLNTTFALLGVRSYPDLKLLEPGDELQVSGADGKLLKAWVDKETRNDDGVVFDIQRNIEYMQHRHAIIRLVDGVTTPNPVLTSYLKDVVGARNAYTYPNTVKFEDYPEFNLAPRKDGKIRLLWQGSMSHYVDWYPLRNALQEVCRKYPNVVLVMFGDKFGDLLDLPKGQMEFIGWVPYQAYKMRRGMIQADINICPLADNIFNRCKSAIKWYEASVWKRPEVTIAANVGPYAAEMTDGENGLLYSTPEEFVQKISLLIENEQLRRTLAENAKQWVKDNRTPEKTTPGLLDFYTELRAKRARDIYSYGSPVIQQMARAAGIRED